jgi:hypothetical protein
MFQYSFSSLKEKNPDIYDYQGNINIVLLTHRGSNPDSSEPKSDVLPITPWVSQFLKCVAKLEKKSNSDGLTGFLLFRSSNMY